MGDRRYFPARSRWPAREMCVGVCFKRERKQARCIERRGLQQKHFVEREAHKDALVIDMKFNYLLFFY